MANSLLTINMITREAVMLFKNSNLFIQNIDTQYDKMFAIDGAKIGTSVRIRLPNDYVVRSGPAMSIQDTAEQFTTLNLSTQFGVDVGFTSVDRTMSLDDYSERILEPMMNNLVGAVALNVMTNVVEGGVCNFIDNVDGAGTIITPTQRQFLLANAKLTDNSASMLNRKIVLSPTTNANTVNALTGLLNPSQEISSQYMSGMMKSGLGYRKWFEDQTVINHTSGTYDSASTVNGAQNNTTTLTVTALNGTLKAGDIITIDTVNAVNWVTKADIGSLRQFVVTANVANGATSIPIFPAIVAPTVAAGPTSANGLATVQYQSVAPIGGAPNGATVRLVAPASSVYRKNIAFTREAFTMATADLILPQKGIVEGARAVYDGVSLRMITAYLPGTDVLATRSDVLFGSLSVRPQWACAVADAV